MESSSEPAAGDPAAGDPAAGAPAAGDPPGQGMGSGPLLHRLIGLETEYALRFSPRVGADEGDEPAFQGPQDPRHPGNDTLFQAFKRAIAAIVPTRPGSGAPGRDQFFTANGGAFYYEFLPHCTSGGLLEGATPECRSPTQLLLYQRAQERLLLAALPQARAITEGVGFEGQLGLLKNCRDAEGHIYGAQENYEVEIARGPLLGLYRLGLLLLLPLVLIQAVLTYALLLVLFLGFLLGLLVAMFVPPWHRHLHWLAEAEPRDIERVLGPFHLGLTVIVTWPLTKPFAGLLYLTAFRAQRRALVPFLISRTLITGSGAVDSQRRFRLAQKAPAITTLCRSSVMPENRPIFDFGNLMKRLCALLNLQIRPLFQLFRRRQRLQLGHGDSNRAEVAEWLKMGLTSLMLDLIDAGQLDDAPRLADPLAALHAVADDLSLAAPLPLVGGGAMTALEIQRFYLERARRHLRRASMVSLEARELVTAWGDALDALEKGDRAVLVGRLDWVTKRVLLEEGDDDPAVLSTLDLRYHELGNGYWDQLAQALDLPQMLDDEAIDRAVQEPPHDTPAYFRGRLIRQRVLDRLPLVVSWETAVLGSRLGGKVIPFRRPGGG